MKYNPYLALSRNAEPAVPVSGRIAPETIKKIALKLQEISACDLKQCEKIVCTYGTHCIYTCELKAYKDTLSARRIVEDKHLNAFAVDHNGNIVICSDYVEDTPPSKTEMLDILTKRKREHTHSALGGSKFRKRYTQHGLDCATREAMTHNSQIRTPQENSILVDCSYMFEY
jgi:hypothetical protein